MRDINGTKQTLAEAKIIVREIQDPIDKVKAAAAIAKVLLAVGDIEGSKQTLSEAKKIDISNVHNNKHVPNNS